MPKKPAPARRTQALALRKRPNAATASLADSVLIDFLTGTSLAEIALIKNLADYDAAASLLRDAILTNGFASAPPTSTPRAKRPAAMVRRRRPRLGPTPVPEDPDEN